MKNTVTCRPCKERPGTWEIENQNGKVLNKHFATKEAAAKEARRLANETASELVITDTPKSN